MSSSPSSIRRGRSGSLRVFTQTPLVLLFGILCVLLFAPNVAFANDYTGLLYGGTLNMTSADHSESGGYVYASRSWTAPAGVQFGGFAYTSGAFSSVSDNSVGGVSAGFGGDGTANQPSILFPWTTDCSITNKGHYWTNTSATVVAGTSGSQTCVTNGNTSAWNLTNAELENTNPSVDPWMSYHTLWLTVFCQAGTCNYDSGRQWGTAGVSVTNLSGYFLDPDSQPTGDASWSSAVQGGSWYQTNSGGLAVNISASDPAGVCAMYGALTGASMVTSGPMGHQNPGVVNVGAEIGSEFLSGTDPCWVGQTDAGTWILPGGLTAGAYNVEVHAANPGNFESQGFSSVNSPVVASYGNSVYIDDSTPALSWSSTPSGWTSKTSETLEVSVGPSGLSGVTCTDNGRNVSPALASGSTAGGGTTVWTVPTVAAGVNAISCTARNGDINGSLAGSTSQTFEVDTTTPTIRFTVAGYRQGEWSNAEQSISITATGGPSGIHSTACSIGGGASEQLSSSSGGTIAIGTDGVHVLACIATSGTGVRGSATYTVNIDTEQPTLTFLVNGGPPSTAYVSGTPVVTVIGSEVGGILSGLEGISCSVNGGPSFALSGIDAGSDYTGSFELDQNGADHVSCIGTTVAGTVQAAASEATVNVDNPNYAPNASTLIDNGTDPYSNGPSQSQWYVTPQSVTITADNTGGDAPIAAISCKGAASGSWPVNALNADSRGGEQITVTVPAPGGDLSCAAEDSAGNVYVLGSYLFQIDATAPKGSFVSRAKWPEPNEIELHVTDNGGSGVALVRVYGQSPDVEQGAPQLVGNASYDSKTGDYEVRLPDGVAPWVAGSWKFYANVADVAGNQGQITAGPDGGTEALTLPLRENTAVSAVSDQVTATPDVAIPDALAAAVLPKASAGSLRAAGSEAASSAGGPAPTVMAARDHRARADHHVLRVDYGRAITITGTLEDVTHHGIPISGARIVVYQQLLGTHRYVRIGWTRTNARGAYRYRAKPGASRTLYVVYPGNAQLRPAASQLLEHSKGSLTLQASNIKAGGKLVITGRVRGGHIPRAGLVVTIDYRQAGAPGSGTLGTVRTDRRGRYRFTQHFSATTRGLTYEVWAVVPSGQPGWPYLGASTVRVARRVA